MKIHEPPMTFLDESKAAEWLIGLENNEDPYGRACFRYASEWATRMERGMAADGVDTAVPAAVEKWIKANASRVSHEADTEGITGFMYGMGVNILANAWKWGEQLRRW